jgi:hypothetical protein
LNRSAFLLAAATVATLVAGYSTAGPALAAWQPRPPQPCTCRYPSPSPSATVEPVVSGPRVNAPTVVALPDASK